MERPRKQARLRSYPREKRVRKRADFVRIQSHGARVNTPHFLLLLERRAPSSHASHASNAGNTSLANNVNNGPTAQDVARLGVVASRKIGCAVVRNRAKRLLREAFRTNPDIFPAGVDVVIIIRQNAHLLTLPDVTAELRAVAKLIARRAQSARL